MNHFSAMNLEEYETHGRTEQQNPKVKRQFVYSSFELVSKDKNQTTAGKMCYRAVQKVNLP